MYHSVRTIIKKKNECANTPQKYTDMRFNQIRRKKYERKFRRKEILDKKRLGRMRENIKFLAVSGVLVRSFKDTSR